MTKDQIWSWLKMFKEKILKVILVSGTTPITEVSTVGSKDKFYPLKGHYCRTVGPGQLTGSERPRKLDFLIKSVELPLDAVTDWNDIGVIGELNDEPTENARKEKFGQLTRYAREIFCSQPLRRFLHGFCLYETDLELWLFDRSGAYSTGIISIRDSQEYLVRAISSYLLMSKNELGFDQTIKEKNGVYFVQIKKEGSKSSKKYKINPVPIIRPKTLVNRGTTCFETTDELNIIKCSWSRDPGAAEVKLLKEARGTKGVVEYVMSDKIWQIKNHGSGPQKPTLKPFKRDRNLTRVVVTPRGYPLHWSRTILEFLVVIRDSIVADRRLYIEKKILHCDVSEGNVVLVRPDGDNSIRGMLIDLDHAVSSNVDTKKDGNSLLTGTVKFMALERLDWAVTKNKTIQCTYCHDLESFFYVFLVGCIDFFDLKDLAIKLRTIMFGESTVEVGTPDDPNPMYEGMIAAFSNTIEQIRGKINLP
ncbi:BgTH12-03811 [Blumeria graminis f. sp. triticale]|uniref:BgTH12-03811 n=1 Tax=Blumeria graminis f. sp. triticale TaxID=1689686 RepID=A0A9W4GCT2_BLUGR|nr:BgTH12-03811 [Blumeria graminis f. sp. triticale]